MPRTRSSPTGAGARRGGDRPLAAGCNRPWRNKTAMAASRPTTAGRDAMRTDAAKTIEDRIRAIEDRLEIYNLIASHPPSADTGAQPYIQSIFVDDAMLDLGGAKRADGNQAISADRDAPRAWPGDQRRPRAFRRPAACDDRRRPRRGHVLSADPRAASDRRRDRGARRTARRAAIASTASAPTAGSLCARRKAGRSSGAPIARSTAPSPRSTSCGRRSRRRRGANA